MKQSQEPPVVPRHWRAKGDHVASRALRRQGGHGRDSHEPRVLRADFTDELDRKVLADMAVQDEKAFSAIADKAKAALAA